MPFFNLQNMDILEEALLFSGKWMLHYLYEKRAGGTGGNDRTDRI